MYVTQEEVRELFDYRDGRLFWKNGPSKGKPAGYKSSQGLNVVNIDGTSHSVRRLIWLHQKGEPVPTRLARIDPNGGDAIENLREIRVRKRPIANRDSHWAVQLISELLVSEGAPSLRSVAEITGVSRSTLNSFLDGKVKSPRIDVVETLLNFFGWELDVLRKEDGRSIREIS